MSRFDKKLISAAVILLVTVIGAVLYISSRPINITPAAKGCVIIEQAGLYSYHCAKVVEINEPIFDERE